MALRSARPTSQDAPGDRRGACRLVALGIRGEGATRRRASTDCGSRTGSACGAGGSRRTIRRARWWPCARTGHRRASAASEPAGTTTPRTHTAEVLHDLPPGGRRGPRDRPRRCSRRRSAGSASSATGGRRCGSWPRTTDPGGSTSGPAGPGTGRPARTASTAGTSRDRAVRGPTCVTGANPYRVADRPRREAR